MNVDRTELLDLSHSNQPVVKELAHQFNAWTDQIGAVEWSRLIEKLQRAWKTSDVLGS